MSETTSSTAPRGRGREHEGELSPLGEMIRLVELRRRRQLSADEFERAKRELQHAS